LQLDVISTLIPTEAELEEVFWKTLTPIVEEDDNASQHVEGDEVEHDVEPHHASYQHSPSVPQPPPVSHELNIVDFLRTEMEKLEGRLQAVISTQIDRVEKKVDRLIELAVTGRFHSGTSAFDGATGSTADVPEAEPKDGLENEVGFDDVTNVPIDGRNVEELVNDPKLEEEVRGENVGGKRTEVGFGDDMEEQGKEKMVEEDVEKETMVEDEHLDVEKCSTDFVTPEKLKVDANESTPGM
jgi:hypothetical protein